MKSFKQYLGEKLKASDDMGDWVKDFQDSDAPQFKGKSKEKRRQMAIAAKLDAEREAGMRKEEVELDEISKKTLGSYIKKASDQVSDRGFEAGFKSGRGKSDDVVMKPYKKGEKRLAGIAKATNRLTKEEVELDEAVEVSHDRYMRSHGKRASGGEGSWMFTHKRMGDANVNDPKEVHSARGKFSDAKKSAQQWAKKHGHSTVYVMEEVELDEAAPKMKGDWLKKERERNRAHDAAMGRTPTGRKKPVRQMTSTQKSLAKMRGEEVEQIVEKAPGILRKMVLKHKLNKGIRQTAADRDAMVRSGKTWPEMEKEYDKSLAKRDSMKKALARLNKNEEVELDEGILKSYHSIAQKPWSQTVKDKKGTAGEYSQIAKGKDFTVWTGYSGSLKKQAHYVVRDDKIIGSGWTMNSALKDAGLKDKDLTARSKFAAGSILNKGMKESVDLDEVLDTPKAMDSYRNKAKYSRDRAANSAAAKMLRNKNGFHSTDTSDELNTMDKRAKGLKMADRAAARKTRAMIMKKEEAELDEAKTDIYHKHMLKALGKSRLPKNHSYTSAIANNGDFVVKDGGGRTVGRIPKGEHNLKD